LFSLDKKWQQIKWIVITVGSLFVLGILYSLFNNNSSSSVFIMLVTGIFLGAALMYFFIKSTKTKSPVIIRESSHTIVESIKKVFKVVCAEGHFNEMYDYEETKQVLSFIPSTKKALVIIKAKVLIGFDFDQCVWEANEATKKISLVSFPQPQILSIETDFKYYNMENGIFNKFSKEDLMEIHAQGKKQIEMAAHKSDLPKIASEQLKTLITELLVSKNWSLENSSQNFLLNGAITNAI
jgi:xanthosine utilization system XapX-like protein